MTGPTHPGEHDPEPDADEGFPLEEPRTDVLDWLDRIIPIAMQAPVPGRQTEELPIARVEASAAEIAACQARALLARAAGDAQGECEALTKLARYLAAHSYDLGAAVQAAKRALTLAEDDVLRGELALWLESLGDPLQAVAVLRPCLQSAATDRVAVELMVRIARLLIRGGERDAALETFIETSRGPGDGAVQAAEAAGLLAAAMGIPQAPSLLLEAAKRHELLGDKAKAFVARRRAFEVGPASADACRALVDTLDRAGRHAASDEVLRVHAAACEPALAAEVHCKRIEHALKRADLATAIHAVVDGRLEADGDEGRAALVDRVFGAAGLYELVAVRLEVRAAGAERTQRAAWLRAEARVLMGRLASPDRALEAWIDAVGADPENDEGIQALRLNAAATRDQMPLVEGLVRASMSAASASTRLACLRELVTIADERLADPSLAFWAWTEMVSLGHDDEAGREARASLEGRVRVQEAALESVRSALQGVTGQARVEPLRRAASILRGRPAQAQEYLGVLCELVELVPKERRWWVDLERVAMRMGQYDLLAPRVRAFLEGGIQQSERTRLRMLLAVLALRRGDYGAALDEARGVAGEEPAGQAAPAMAWVAATLLGNNGARAEALEQLASRVDPSLRTALLAIAGGLWLGEGQSAQAARLIDLASRGDSAEPRVLALQALLAMAPGAQDVRALENACAAMLAPAAQMDALASAYDRIDDRRLAFTWTRRLFELRPWDAGVIDRLVTSVIAIGSGDELVAVLGDALASIQSTEAVAGVVDRGIRALAAMDPPQAIAMAHRAVSSLGVRDPLLRTALLEVASGLGQAKLASAILERWLASGAPSETQGELLVQLADHYHALDDSEGEAIALMRAAAAGHNARAVLARLDGCLGSATGDALLARYQARALALEALGQESIQEAAEAWRLLGAALWDLADDRTGAVRAWTRAMALDEKRGTERLARDLEAFAGVEQAHQVLADFALSLGEPPASARLLVIASALALRASQPLVAIELGTQALDLEATRTDALVVIERASDLCGRPDVVDGAYRTAAQAAMGRVGRRTAHHRAARELDRRGRADLALEHAIASLEADATDGAVLRLMLNLAARVDPAPALQALGRIADREKDPEQRAFWLRHGAQLAHQYPEHARGALDMALMALHADPDVPTARLVVDAQRDILRAEPDERDILELRLQRALKACAPRLEGPRGARVAIQLARFAVEGLGSPSLAMDWVRLALSCSGDVDEYEQLQDATTMLVADRDAVAGFLDAVIERVRSPGDLAGAALLTFSSTLALALDDESRGAALADAASVGPPSVHEDPFAGFGGDEDEPARSGAPAAQPQERVQADDAESASPARPGTLPGLAQPRFGSERQTQKGMARALDVAMAAASTPEPEDSLIVASSLEARGDMNDAIALLEAELGRAPSRAVEIDRRLRELYAATGRHSQLCLVLDRLAERASEPGARLSLLVESASLFEARGEFDAARARWMQVSALDPMHPGVIAFFERDAVERGDHEAVADLLLRRAIAAPSLDDRRTAMVQRATILHEQLGRTAQAVEEIEVTLQDLGEDESLLRILAELTERVHGGSRAAQAWARLSRVARERGSAVRSACKAAAAWLAEGEHDRAREVVTPVQDSRAPLVVELLVEIERKSGNTTALGDALQELAIVSPEPQVRRARWFLEAANLALQSGDRALAIERAARASRMAPDDPDIELGSIHVRYRAGEFAGGPEVSTSLERLGAIAQDLKTSDVPLHAFLTAEAVGLVRGADAALDLLMQRRAEVGIDPLIALGLAERIALQANPEKALELFDIAMTGSDELRGVRSRLQVAMGAARAALRSREPMRARRYVDQIERDPGGREIAQAMRAELDQALHEAATREARNVPSGLPIPLTTRAHRPQVSAPAALGMREAGQRAHTLRSFGPSEPLADMPGRESPASARESYPMPSSIPRSFEEAVKRLHPPEWSRPTPAVGSIAPASPDEGVESAPESTVFVPAGEREDEEQLFAALGRGSIEAGDALALLVSHDPSRTHDLCAVRRRQVVLDPTDVRRIEQLRGAAVADQNAPLALAVEHVLGVLGDTDAPSPPPMDRHEQPERVMAMLFRGVHTTAAEALALLWESAPNVLSREQDAYDLESMERVAFGASSPVGRAHSNAARILGIGDVSVFCRRSHGPLQVAVALTVPPAVVITGEIEDSDELRFRVACMLAATVPANIVLFGLPEAKVRRLLRGMVAAFGPPDSSRKERAAVVEVAEQLWHALPARAQRRMHEIFADPSAITYEDLWARALQSTRRAGLFVVGHLGVALGDVLDDPGVRGSVDVLSAEAMLQVGRCSPSAADLIRLATSSEYAHARWRSEATERPDTYNPVGRPGET